jgi:NADPH-dependent glutamate synthase beta subunit-like oxidoreductase/Pyruvate/2-oxoacid:ferredoxin oxidoreductase delta subunit
MSPFEHVDDYPEIPVSLASTRTALKTGGWRSVRPVLAERTAPCAAACPGGVPVPVWLDQARAGDLDAALASFMERNPFPRITGRVCPHRCEAACNLARVSPDEPVSVRAVERWLGDVTAHRPHPRPHDPTWARVAVVGSGPAGLAAAYFLRRTGHAVTVFERRHLAGGMLRHAIPAYRMPTTVVDAEVTRLEDMGIEFRTGVAVGFDMSLPDLAAEYDAVFVATGAWIERGVGVDGEHLLTPGLGFLEGVRHGDVPPPGLGCAVVGAGNTAMDVARVLRRLGSDVTVVYRRTAEEMPAIAEEYLRAVDEGVRFEWLCQPRSVEEDGGRLRLTVEGMRLGDPDASGRRRPEPTGETRVLECDRVYSAVGEVADASPFPPPLLGADHHPAVDEDGATVDRRIFAGGDLVTGPATVIEAIAAGRRAARAIDRHLGFADRWPPERSDEAVGPTEVNPAHRHRFRRVVESRRGLADPPGEETLTVSEVAALVEMERCLSCGHCNACGVCRVLCPDAAMLWDGGPVVDYEYCKGCGICVVECPGRAMTLVPEREAAHV